MFALHTTVAKRPRTSNLMTEEVLERIFQEGEDHLGMSSDEESEFDRELECQSEI